MTTSCESLRIVEMAPSRLALFGELDLACVAYLEQRLVECEGDVVLDCSGLTFVDASGLRSFMQARNQYASRGALLTLADPAPCLTRVLSITGLDALLLDGPDR